MADLSPEQFAVSVLQGIGVKPSKANVQAMVGWTRAEGGHWKNQAKYNPLNTTQPMAGAGNTGSQGNIKVYKNWQQGIEATVTTLKNGRYGGIISALKGNDPSKVASAIGQSPWGTNATLAAQTIAGAKGAHIARLASAAGGTTTSTPLVGQEQVTTPTFDQAGYQQAQRQAILGRLLQQQGQNAHNNPLFQLGILGADDPNPADYTGSTTSTLPTIAGNVVRTTPTPQPTAAGTFKIAKGADLPGRNIQKVTQDFFSDVAGHAGKTLTVTTGTNHDRLTVNGRVSDHFDGHAGDFGVPVDSQEGDTLAAHALVAAGVPWKTAYGMAKKGGLWTITPTKGQFKGRRIQVIWRTNEGGNHHNHVHIGIR